jgi:hypothetical protein
MANDYHPWQDIPGASESVLGSVKVNLTFAPTITTPGGKTEFGLRYTCRKNLCSGRFLFVRSATGQLTRANVLCHRWTANCYSMERDSFAMSCRWYRCWQRAVMFPFELSGYLIHLHQLVLTRYGTLVTASAKTKVSFVKAKVKRMHEVHNHFAICIGDTLALTSGNNIGEASPMQMAKWQSTTLRVCNPFAFSQDPDACWRPLCPPTAQQIVVAHR